MHPALSVIFFTTLSGAGYGLLALLGLLAPVGLLPQDRWFGGGGMLLALGLIALGLLSSTFHLRHPERAWRAVSQWRSSWLSREGVLSLLTFVPAGLFAIGWVFAGRLDSAWALAGLAAAAGAALTVFSTGKIYATLKPIRQWHNRLVVPLYLAFALMTGALWLNALLHGFSMAEGHLAALVMGATALAWSLKMIYWREIDSGTSESTPESATGLGRFGKVRVLAPPHTEENYLLREMAYSVARKHALKLRRISLLLGLAMPLFLTAGATLSAGLFFSALAVGAALSGMGGVLVERWLFFAEAKHSVTLYYGAEAA